MIKNKYEYVNDGVIYEHIVNDDLKYQLKVKFDYNGCGSRSWDNFGKMICFHDSFNIGDEHDMSEEELKEVLKLSGTISLPIYLYDHSGQTISTKPFGCQWDSGCIGAIYATEEMIEKEFGTLTDEVKNTVLSLLISEVEMEDVDVRGKVRYIEKIKIERCNLGHWHEEHEDSLYSLYTDEEVREYLSTYDDDLEYVLVDRGY